MPKNEIKCPVKLNFFDWFKPGDKRPMIISADDPDMNSNKVLIGTVTIDKGALYELLRKEREEHTTAVFELIIPGNDKPSAPPKEDDGQEKIDLTPKPKVR